MRKLNDVFFRVSSYPIPYFMALIEENNRTVFAPEGMWSNIFLLLQEKMQFSYAITELAYEGGEKLNGTWNGQTASLHKKEVDIAPPLEISSEKLEVIDLSDPLLLTGIKFFTRTPKEVTKIFAPIRPFGITVWLSALAVFLFSVAALYFIFRITKTTNEKTLSVYEVSWALFGSFTNKGSDIFNPAEQKRRWVVCGWILSMFVLVSSYSGALLSFITFPGKEPVPRNFQELITAVQSGRYTVSAYLDNDIGQVIKAAETSTASSLNEFRKKGKMIGLTLDTYYLLILKTNNGYIIHNILGQILSYEYGKELFLESEDSLYISYMGFGFTKNFPYKKYFNQMFRRITETGFVQKYINKELLVATMKRKSISVEENPSDMEPLKLEDLVGPFCILLIGYCLSSITLILEYTIHKFLTNSKVEMLNSV